MKLITAHTNWDSINDSLRESSEAGTSKRSVDWYSKINALRAEVTGTANSENIPWKIYTFEKFYFHNLRAKSSSDEQQDATILQEINLLEPFTLETICFSSSETSLSRIIARIKSSELYQSRLCVVDQANHIYEDLLMARKIEELSVMFHTVVKLDLLRT